RFLTVHFSNPAPFIPGVELVAGEATTQEVIDSVKDLLVRTGREGAQVADTPGMALNRLQYALLKEATLIVEQGVATKEDVDTIVRTTFGFRL
ncbi:3-hydroxyacyl-CoA dehydrogenase, partial [Enterococcus faecium]